MKKSSVDKKRSNPGDFLKQSLGKYNTINFIGKLV